MFSFVKTRNFTIYFDGGSRFPQIYEPLRDRFVIDISQFMIKEIHLRQNY